ncbi:PapG chaperone-binding domain-containing protein, partial [Escherichia coli]|uniref:PapG chaperone-binding domain-containing protein n=1 Tax=Escherichia coli TaxID=562 RepID=UPI001918B700
MKKNIYLLCLTVLLSSSAYANLYSYLWVSHNHARGSILYTGPAQTDISGAMDSFFTGTMHIAYADCDEKGDKYMIYNGHDLWIFIPSSITVNGKIITLLPDTPSGYSYKGQLSGGEYAFNKYTVKPDGGVLGKCNSVGITWPMNDTYPAISLKAKISGLPAGTYTGAFPVRLGYGDYYTATPEISRFPETLIYEHSTVVQIPYSIKITNTCQLSSTNITIDHGQFSIREGNGNFVKKDISINCDGEAQLTIDFQPLTVPTTLYKNGVGVGLGHGFDAVVQIGDLGLSNASTAKTIRLHKGTTTMPLTSTIHENDNPSVGTLY